MATSTVPTLKANLMTRLLARTGLTGVQVSYGIPLPDPQPEFIWLGDVDGDQYFAALGHRAREEDYTLTVTVDVLRRDSDQQSATERAYAIAAEIENELRDDPTVNGAVRTAEIKGRMRLSERHDDQAREAMLELSIYCQHRI